MSEGERLDRLESIEAIRQLVARYALATDSRDFQAWTSWLGLATNQSSPIAPEQRP